MLDYLCVSLLYTPFRSLLVLLTIGVACGLIGWWRSVARFRAAWECVLYPEIVGLGPYRAASSKTRRLRMPRPVSVLAFTSCALWAGHVGAIVVSIDAALRTNVPLAAGAVAVAGFGIVMARGARTFIFRRHVEMRAVRRRIELCAMLALLVHGVVVLGLGALAMGWFDAWSFDAYYPGLHGKWASHWRMLTLGEFVHKPGFFFLAPMMGSHFYVTWRVIIMALSAHACATLVEAAIVLGLARQAGLRGALGVASVHG